MTIHAQVIAILETALANPAYLNPAFDLKTGQIGAEDDGEPYHEHANNWMCNIVGHELESTGHDHYSDPLKIAVMDEISRSIEFRPFLRMYLREKGIPIGYDYSSPEYKVSAHAHWSALIERLKAEK